MSHQPSKVISLAAVRLARGLSVGQTASSNGDLHTYQIGDKVRVLSVQFNDILWVDAVVTDFNTTSRTGLVTLTSGKRQGVQKHVTAVQLKPVDKAAAMNGLA